MCGDNELMRAKDENALLGLSTYLSSEYFDMDESNLKARMSYEKVKFIVENHLKWRRIKVYDEAKTFINYEETHSPQYKGFLINHSKKKAVDLANYFTRSMYNMKISTSDWPNSKTLEILSAIDPIPVLSETGGGTGMALFDGMTADTTKELTADWCGDLLQIVDELPEGFEVIDCCFAECWTKADFCYELYRTNADGLLLKNKAGDLFEVTKMNVFGKRGSIANIKVELTEDKIRFSSVLH